MTESQTQSQTGIGPTDSLGAEPEEGPAIGLDTECSWQEQLNLFLANRLEAAGRQVLLGHVAVCELCAGMLRDLREDERLSRLPLTAAERAQIRLITGSVEARLASRLEAAGQQAVTPALPPGPGSQELVAQSLHALDAKVAGHHAQRRTELGGSGAMPEEEFVPFSLWLSQPGLGRAAALAAVLAILLLLGLRVFLGT